MSNELFVLHKDGELLRTDAGSGRFKRKRSWAFVTESAAKQQAKHHKNSEVVRYVPAKAELCTHCGHSKAQHPCIGCIDTECLCAEDYE